MTLSFFKSRHRIVYFNTFVVLLLRLLRLLLCYDNINACETTVAIKRAQTRVLRLVRVRARINTNSAARLCPLPNNVLFCFLYHFFKHKTLTQ